jgi:hypothetical protein
LLKNLSEIKLGANSVEKFAEEISCITQKLTAIKVKDLNLPQEQETIVGKIYESQALSAFKKGLKGGVQQAVCAARPETLEDALVVAAT